MQRLYAADILTVAPNAREYAADLVITAARFDINTVLRQAHWLGQMYVESGGYRKVRESLNYKASALVPIFGTRRISHEQANRYGRTANHPADQEALANILYGGGWGARNLGNTEPGDGWRFIGRGLKQITGRSNYKAVSLGLYGDDRLLHHPELLEAPEAACLSSGYYWDVMRDLNPLADADKIVAITKKINGGTNGLEGPNGRRYWTARFKAVLEASRPPDFSNVTSHVDTVPVRDAE